MLSVGTDCSGIDAPLYAFKKLRIPVKHIFSCENDKFAKRALLANHTPELFYDNIYRDHIRAKYTDFYFLGFPCQSFSTAGSRLGTGDLRGNVFFEGFKHIKQARPRVFVLENVKGLLSIEKGNLFKTIMKYLEGIKEYNIYFKILNSKHYGVPQNRERVYIVGIKKSWQKRTFQFPKPNTVIPDIQTILEPGYYKPVPLGAHEIGILREERKKFLQKGIDIYKENYVIDSAAGKGYGHALKGISPCLKATRSYFYLTKHKRRLLPRECLRLQGFPESFKIVESAHQTYKQAGNTMTVNVLAALIREIMKSLS